MIDNLVVEVDQKFIDYRNNQVKTGKYSPWNNFKNSDYLLLERNLIKRKLINEPIPYKNESYAWRYDGSLDGSKNDFKHFKRGDILKASSWHQPALNQARGNIFETYNIQWTGPRYLN